MGKIKTAREVFDQLAVKAVSAVTDRVDNAGELGAYEGIEAAREIREMILAAHLRIMKSEMGISKEKLTAMREEALRTNSDLCKTLASIAAFHVEDKRTQKKIYQAIRHLQLLAILPATAPKTRRVPSHTGET